MESLKSWFGSMKTTIDIPEEMLQDAMRFAGARTKREAVVTAVADYNRRCRMAALTRHLGSCRDFVTVSELERARSSS